MKRRALVTGGSKGIGLATARALQAAGDEVTILCRTDPGIRDLNWAACDVMNKEALRLVARALPEVQFDILINNVGGGGRWGSTFALTPYETYEEVYWKNTGVAVTLTKAIAPGMAERGWGRVVTVSSIYGKESGGRPWFTMAKAAEITFMKEMSKDPTYVRRGVTFNTVAPGRVGVGKPLDMDPKDLPMGRFGKPEEVAAVIAFLCSEEASLVNGSCWVVDGGESHGY